MAINQANMLKVAQALRSGEFTQAKGALHRIKSPDWIIEALADESHEDHQVAKNDNESTTGYCCLGVACEVTVREGVVSRRVYGSDSRHVSTGYEYGDFSKAKPAYSDSFLPTGVQNWLGVPSGDILFKLEGDKLEKALAAGVDFYNRKYERDGYLIVSASVLNDRMGFTFNDMAALFESGKIMDDYLSDAQELERV
jgi:hypothetical protein